MEEVPGALHCDHARPHFKSREPRLGGREWHDVVGRAVDQEPRAIGRLERCRQLLERRGNGHEAARTSLGRDLERDGRAEREAAEKEVEPRPAIAAPRDRGVCVGALADAFRMASFRCADSAKVEAQDVRAELRERARDGRHDFVLHGSLLQRMRVADHGERARRRVDGVDRRLEPSGRAGHDDGLCLHDPAHRAQPLSGLSSVRSSFKRFTNAAGSSSWRPSAKTACSNRRQREALEPALVALALEPANERVLGVQLETRNRGRRLVARGLEQLAHLIAEVVLFEHEASGRLAQPPADAHFVDTLAQHALHALQELFRSLSGSCFSGLRAELAPDRARRDARL